MVGSGLRHRASAEFDHLVGISPSELHPSPRGTAVRPSHVTAQGGRADHGARDHPSRRHRACHPGTAARKATFRVMRRWTGGLLRWPRRSWPPPSRPRPRDRRSHEVERDPTPASHYVGPPRGQSRTRRATQRLRGGQAGRPGCASCFGTRRRTAASAAGHHGRLPAPRLTSDWRPPRGRLDAGSRVRSGERAAGARSEQQVRGWCRPGAGRRGVGNPGRAVAAVPRPAASWSPARGGEPAGRTPGGRPWRTPTCRGTPRTPDRGRSADRLPGRPSTVSCAAR